MTRKKRLCFILLSMTISTALVLFAAEVALRILTPKRVQALDYGDVFIENKMRSGPGPGGYLKPDMDVQVVSGLGGTVPWKTNSSGFRNDREFSPVPDEGVVRVLSVGDSFAAGYRVGQEDTYSRRLEVWSNDVIGRTEVLVAQAECLRRALLYLTKHGQNWSPDFVLMGLTVGNDIAQALLSNTRVLDSDAAKNVVSMGLPDGCVRTPGFLESSLDSGSEWLRQTSMIYSRLMGAPRAIGARHTVEKQLRLFDSSSGFGTFLREPPEPVEIAYRRAFALLGDLQEFLEKRSISFAVILIPQRYQVQPGDWDACLTRYKLVSEKFDLDRPNRLILEFCRKKNIVCIDVTEKMRAYHLETGEDLYLPFGDMHWNPAGHEQLVNCAKAELEPHLRAVAKRRGIEPGG